MKSTAPLTRPISRARTRFILVRHGETEWNELGRIQGQLDSALTARGIAQAESVAARLKLETFDHLVCSDLGRALSTAEIIARETRLPIEVDARLRERHYGIFQGLTREEAQAAYCNAFAEYEAESIDHRIPRGESAKDCLIRALACLEELAVRRPSECIVIVAHGGVLDGLRRHVLRSPYEAGGAFTIPNGGLDRLSYRRGDWGFDLA